MRIRLNLVLQLLAFGAGLFSAIAPAYSAETVRFLVARPGWQTISVWYAKDMGFFAKHNVKVQLLSLDSSSSVMEGFVSGQGDIAIANVGTSINAYFRGVPVRIVAGTPGSDYPIMTMSQSIHGISELKGKKIAVWSVPNDATLALNTLAQKKGLKPSDYTYVHVPAQNICDTLKRGQVDVGIVFEPYASACLLNGAHRVAPPGTISFEPPKIVSSSVVIVNSDFLKKNSSAVKATLEALDEAVKWASKNKSKAVQLLGKYSGQPEKAIALSYDSVNFNIGIDRKYHDVLLKQYREAGFIQRAPTAADMKALYQTHVLKH